jgi:hypothetical protein
MRKRSVLLEKDVRVVLVCGCRIRLHDAPKSPYSKFACEANKGHGYNVGWVSWSDINSETSVINQRSGK